MSELLTWGGQLMSPHLGLISMALASAIIVLVSPRLAKLLKSSLHGYPWIIRVSAFVIMCAAGYGAMTVALGHGLHYVLRDISKEALALMVPMAFIALGMVAERRGEL